MPDDDEAQATPWLDGSSIYEKFKENKKWDLVGLVKKGECETTDVATAERIYKSVIKLTRGEPTSNRDAGSFYTIPNDVSEAGRIYIQGLINREPKSYLSVRTAPNKEKKTVSWVGGTLKYQSYIFFQAGKAAAKITVDFKEGDAKGAVGNFFGSGGTIIDPFPTSFTSKKFYGYSIHLNLARRSRRLAANTSPSHRVI